MPIDVTSLNSLDPSEVRSREDFIIELIKEVAPTLDLTRGGLLEQLLAYPNALLDVMNQEELDRLRKSMSLLEVSEDPELADEAILDKLLSNYLITRSEGTQASGEVTVVISSLASVALPAGTTFTVNGRTFRTTTELIAVTTPDLITGDLNVLIQSDGQGNYWFPVTVVEDVVGGDAIRSGTEFEVSPEPTDFVQAYAPLDFNSGAPAASNTDMYRELEEGIAAKAMSDRVSISALLRSEFPQIINMSTVGFGDAEMSRDAYNIFGVSGGGKADIYIRTSQNPNQRKLLYAVPPTAALDDSTGLGATFAYNSEVRIFPTVQPGLYRAESLTRYPDITTFGVFLSNISWSEVGDRGIYVPPGEENMPALYTSEEARYTKYQGLVRLQTSDNLSQGDYASLYRERLVATLPLTVNTIYGTEFTITDEAALDALIFSTGFRIYEVAISYMPGIADVQDFVRQYDRQAPTSSDYLVKGVIPCIVSVEFTVAWRAGLEQTDTNTLISAVVSAINATPLGSTELPVATVVNAIDSIIGVNGYTASPIRLTGEILLPDGTTTTITSTDALVIPDASALNSTNRTTAFITYADSSYINLSGKIVE